MNNVPHFLFPCTEHGSDLDLRDTLLVERTHLSNFFIGPSGMIVRRAVMTRGSRTSRLSSGPVLLSLVVNQSTIYRVLCILALGHHLEMLWVAAVALIARVGNYSVWLNRPKLKSPDETMR